MVGQQRYGLWRLLGFGVLAVFMFMGCATVPTEVPQDLTSPELFQRAQEYSDSGNQEAALVYIDAIMERFVQEPLTYITAQYHRALYLQKAKETNMAIGAYQTLLSRYDAETGLPEWIRTLATQKLAELSE
ncbi:MAG: hypothetical protein GW949_06090 [Spirochaetales bacterium]|nr:hypothetical protein [Spirochaetales bacterium]